MPGSLQSNSDGSNVGIALLAKSIDIKYKQGWKTIRNQCINHELK